jgi:hypothetical protein
VIALVRYTLATVVLSQRFLPPVLLFLAALFIFTSRDNGPLVPVYALSSAAVFVCATWLTVAIVNAEDPVQRSVTSVTAGGSGRVLVASVWVACGWLVVITVVGLAYPLTSGQHPVGPAVFALGAAAELTSGCTGVAIGLLCSRLVIRRAGWSALTALAAVLAFLLVPHLPPINPVFRLLANGTSAGPLLVGATVLTRFVALRRD